MNTTARINPCDELEERAAAGAPLRVITITKDRENDFTVREGDRYCPRLCADEAMVMTVKLLNSEFPGYPMMTAEEHAERERERQTRLAARRASEC